MAIGLGRMLGFRFPENFRYPYVAKSITEFWRRWHVTLSSWFREYVYIPMGGNRKGRARQYLNLAVVWLLTGLWHGANWNFVLWGAFFLFFLILEKSFLLQWLSHAPSWLGRGYTFTLVVISFVLFSTPDLALCATRLLQMLGIGVRGFADAVGAYEVRHLLPLLAVALVGATPLVRRFWERICLLQPRLRWLTPVLAVLSLVLCTAYLVDSTFSPFEYTQF
jgi:alginate O-acetyltransferase complex protein AlgI